MRAFDKRQVKYLYKIPAKEKLSNEEYEDKGGFVWGTMIGSGWECKDFSRDVMPFQKKFMPDWNKLLERYKANKVEKEAEWAVFERHKLDFVFNDKTTETFLYPNEYSAAIITPDAQEIKKEAEYAAYRLILLDRFANKLGFSDGRDHEDLTTAEQAIFENVKHWWGTEKSGENSSRVNVLEFLDRTLKDMNN